jgi:glutaredoxin 3
MAEIEIYTQPWCGFCARALAILESKQVPFREINAPNGSPEREEAVRRAGGVRTVPQIFVDGQHLGGCDDLVRLQTSGKLDALLKVAG